MIVVGGEITSSAIINYEDIVRRVASDIGYDMSNVRIEIAVHEQSPDIRNAVDGLIQGAGDQGIMVGFACNETDEMLPIEFLFARRLTNRLEEVRKLGIVKGICADGKSQVSAQFIHGKFDCFTKVVVSIQHKEEKDISSLKEEIRKYVVDYVFRGYDLSNTNILINPSGRFVVGGIEADTGLTGRKIVADAYGPRIPVGGGAFSGKDPSKADRFGAYYARYVAKNIVKSGLANQAQVQISYAIGKAEPLAVNIDTFGTEKVDVEIIKTAVMNVFNFQPVSIIKQLNLLSPIYSLAVKSGHFGTSYFQWENIDKVHELKNFVLKKL